LKRLGTVVHPSIHFTYILLHFFDICNDDNMPYIDAHCV
jgi:hypothetical protein